MGGKQSLFLLFVHLSTDVVGVQKSGADMSRLLFSVLVLNEQRCVLSFALHLRVSSLAKWCRAISMFSMVSAGSMARSETTTMMKVVGVNSPRKMS